MCLKKTPPDLLRYGSSLNMQIDLHKGNVEVSIPNIIQNTLNIASRVFIQLSDRKNIFDKTAKWLVVWKFGPVR